MIAFIINTCEVLDVDINLQYNETLDPTKGTKTDDYGYSEVQTEGPTILSLSGMTCTACTSIVERALDSIDGVERAVVSLPFQEARVVHDRQVSKDVMVLAVEDVGYEAHIGLRAPTQRIETLQQTKELRTLSKGLSGSSWLSSLLFFFGTGSDLFGWSEVLQRMTTPYGRQCILLVFAATISYHHGGFIHRSAWSHARHGSVNMNTLISLSTTLGLLLSMLNVALQGPASPFTYFQTVAGLTMIVTAGRYLDLLSRRQATNTFVGLYSLLQEIVSVKLSGRKVGCVTRIQNSADRFQQRVPASMLRATDQILIEPYTVIPCDSYVVSGSSSVNEAIVTGESLPKAKDTGDFLLAGTRIGPGQLTAIVNQDQNGSFLSQLIATAEDAAASKADVQERVEVITRYFVASVLVLAIAVSSWVYVTSSKDTDVLERINLASQRMMTILAAACPCALGLATPCAVMAGIGRHIWMLFGSDSALITRHRCCMATRHPNHRRSEGHGKTPEGYAHHNGQDWDTHRRDIESLKAKSQQYLAKQCQSLEHLSLCR